MATARFRVYDPIDGSSESAHELESQMGMLACDDPETAGRLGYGYTWERRDGDYSVIWIRTCEAVMEMAKADPRLIWVEDIEEGEEVPVEESVTGETL